MAGQLLQVLAFFCICSAVVAEQTIEVVFEVDQDPSFKIYIAGKEWFRSGALRIRHSGQWWSSGDADKYSLKAGEYSQEEGSDAIGRFNKTV